MLEKRYIFTDSSDSESDYILVEGNTLVDYVGNSNKLIIPEGIEKIKKFKSTFASKCILSVLSIPASVKEIDELAFFECASLRKIIVSPENPHYCSENGVLYNKSRTYIIYCPDIEKLHIPSTVENMDDTALSFCPNLSEITVSDDNKYFSAENNILYDKTKSLLFRCAMGNRAEQIIIPDTVEIIEADAFSNCIHIKSVYIHDNVKNINTLMFRNCLSLEEVRLPDGLKQINFSMFAGDLRLKRIQIPGSVESICAYAFCGCSGLKSIHLPYGVKNLDRFCFAKCSNLKEIVIPESVDAIDEDIFYPSDFERSNFIENLVIHCKENSAAHKYADMHGIKYELQ